MNDNVEGVESNMRKENVSEGADSHKDYTEQLSLMRDKLESFLRSLRAENNEVFNKFNFRGQEFADELSKTYTVEELRSTALYYLIIGSSQPSGGASCFDLPNGEIERFINELPEELAAYKKTLGLLQ